MLVVLGEEDQEEVHRRIHRAARVDGGTTPPEGSIIMLPLTGIACPMIVDGEDAPFLVWLRKYVETTGPYSLICIDPVSRFAGADAERDNAAGTRFCQALESLVLPSGGATVLAARHVNKQSRGSGATVDASSSRGASALTDGVRWVSSIGVEYIEGGIINTVLKFAVVKTNYAKKPSPVDMRYDDNGVLVPLDDTARRVADEAREEADPRARREREKKEAKANNNSEHDAAVIACVKANPGVGATELRLNVKAKAGCSSDAADTAIARMIQAGRIRRTEGKTKQHYLVDGGSDSHVPTKANGVALVERTYSLEDV